jgi:hypothetical protein
MEAMRMCGLKDLNFSFFPFKGKKMHLGSQSKFLVSVPTFWSSAATFEGLPLWKKKKRTRERKRRYETRTVKLFVFVVLFSRKEERRL